MRTSWWLLLGTLVLGTFGCASSVEEDAGDSQSALNETSAEAATEELPALRMLRIQEALTNSRGEIARRSFVPNRNSLLDFGVPRVAWDETYLGVSSISLNGEKSYLVRTQVDFAGAETLRFFYVFREKPNDKLQQIGSCVTPDFFVSFRCSTGDERAFYK